MNPLTIFWVGVCNIILSGVADQIGWHSLAMGVGLAGGITIVASVCVWIAEDT